METVKDFRITFNASVDLAGFSVEVFGRLRIKE